jgi:hypothetical protein
MRLAWHDWSTVNANDSFDFLCHNRCLYRRYSMKVISLIGDVVRQTRPCCLKLSQSHPSRVIHDKRRDHSILQCTHRQSLFITSMQEDESTERRRCMRCGTRYSMAQWCLIVDSLLSLETMSIRTIISTVVIVVIVVNLFVVWQHRWRRSDLNIVFLFSFVYCVVNKRFYIY